MNKFIVKFFFINFFFKILAALKLAERMYNVVTQGLMVKTVRDIVSKGRPATLNNIICKTNVKLRGLNYSLTIENPM